ncbi:MAG: GNAT family N-acetyltransferase [Proteobacteria bacterium]|nr:GNAT family N-acetyltransferase [Pseudomonadota bacterium]
MMIEIRRLERSDDRSHFTCEVPALDRFFRHYAGQNQFRLKLAVTYVAVSTDGIVGFATVAVGSVEKRSLPDPRLRGRMPAYPLPVLRLARLGVEQSAKGRGVGRELLRYVFKLALDQRDTLGCVGVVTDSKPEAREFYEKLGFIPLHGVREGRVHGDPTPMFLDIGTIAAAHK